jgi:hypothetical protein
MELLNLIHQESPLCSTDASAASLHAPIRAVVPVAGLLRFFPDAPKQNDLR